MDAFGFDLGNLSRTYIEIFHGDNFDVLRATEVMGKICAISHAENLVDKDPTLHYCNATHDSFSCWPTTLAGSVAIIGCPHLIISDNTKNASKFCFDNGTWSFSEYNSCRIQKHTDIVPVINETALQIIYNIGYSITIVALFVAFAIFVYFRSLRCLRNTIHCHLIAAFFFHNLTWFILKNALNDVYNNSPGWICRVVVTTYNYFMSVPFFWMFVEGLYLYTTVVWAFSLHKIRLRYYVIIGWGFPMVFTIAWAIVRKKYHDVRCWLPPMMDYEEFYWDYVLYIPIILVLFCNVFFIIDIVWVLITKLKASNSLETRRSRKAVRAAFVLLPLLGLSFILFLLPPSEDPVVKNIFFYITAILQSCQGLLVAVIYCFMNGEVQTVLRKKFMSIQDSRTLSRYTKSSIFSSPHRSSGYAMQQLTTSNQGDKVNSEAKRVNSSESRKWRMSRADDPESETCTCMIENIT